MSCILTCQRSVGEMLRLASLSLAIDDVKVHFDSVTNRFIAVRRHLQKQHILQKTVLY